jgi:hypothetical protein
LNEWEGEKTKRPVMPGALFFCGAIPNAVSSGILLSFRPLGEI